MTNFGVGMVIPVGNGRSENVRDVLISLAEQQKSDLLRRIILTYDGAENELDLDSFPTPACPISILELEKHRPGGEQPRNAGVRALAELSPDLTHVWFLDSDVILDPVAASAFSVALNADPHRVLVGPYDWLPPGVRQPVFKLQNDPRWQSFERHDSGEAVTEDLSAGLACFSGNLIWPIAEFQRVGGFWNELHHGRCEDGELGLRAVAMGVPIGFVREARGWHMDHDRNIEWIEAANARDVPMLNARHPWVEKSGLFVVEQDGKRFDVRCPCGWSGNTALIWDHQAECGEALQVDGLAEGKGIGS